MYAMDDDVQDGTALPCCVEGEEGRAAQEVSERVVVQLRLR